MQDTIQNTQDVRLKTHDEQSLDELFQQKFRLEDDIARLQRERELEIAILSQRYYNRERVLRTQLFKTIAVIDVRECELNRMFGGAMSLRDER